MCEGRIEGLNTTLFRAELTGSSWSETSYTIEPVPRAAQSRGAFVEQGAALHLLYPDGIVGGSSITGSDWWCLPDGCYVLTVAHNHSWPAGAPHGSVYARLSITQARWSRWLGCLIDEPAGTGEVRSCIGTFCVGGKF